MKVPIVTEDVFDVIRYMRGAKLNKKTRKAFDGFMVWLDSVHSLMHQMNRAHDRLVVLYAAAFARKIDVINSDFCTKTHATKVCVLESGHVGPHVTWSGKYFKVGKSK